jgi:hypothetical protein
VLIWGSFPWDLKRLRRRQNLIVTPPKMVPVESTSIQLVGYDGDARELYVQFRRGRTYVYFDVPSSAYAALLEAPSKGRYLNFEIKPYHRYRRV